MTMMAAIQRVCYERGAEMGTAKNGAPTRLETARYRVTPGKPVRVAEWDPREINGFDGDKDSGKDLLPALVKRLETLQEIFYAQGKHRLLIVLQAMDTGGKDSTIRQVFEGVNPQGVKVASFKAPTPLELAHDYLWRVHPHVPGNGEITIFNRSHYEDVLVVRVRNLAPEKVWSKRYEHIKAFEQMLVDEGTTILKFFLHISKDEQKQRLEDRVNDPTKHWKFNPGDLEERKLWDAYMAAYADMLERTSTADAPWYVIPADRKWFRNLLVSQVIVDTLESLDLRYPDPAYDLSGVVIE